MRPERAARGARFLHLVGDTADQGAHERREQGAGAGQHGGVDVTGFGAPAQGFGVSPRQARIDLDHRRPFGAERALEGAMIGALDSEPWSS
jgi:hypothetical protein